MGLWVRDSTAGIGTVTYYNKQDRSFGALGHGVTDVDTEKLLKIEKGLYNNTYNNCNCKKHSTYTEYHLISLLLFFVHLIAPEKLLQLLLYLLI